MKKRFTVLFMSLFAVVSLWAQEFQSGDLYYRIISTGDEGNGVEIENNSSYSDLTEIIIPATVKYEGVEYRVTHIGDGAFNWSPKLTSVTIPNSIISIGDEAFMDCFKLSSIIIPKSVTHIGSRVFSGCHDIKSIMVEAGNSVYDSRENSNAIIETASNVLIRGCENTIIPDGITRIGDDAFDECTGLKSITIPNSVTSIGINAFWGTGLESIIIPNSITSIGNYAFLECINLTSITIPESVTEMGYGVFEYCTGLESVIIANGAISIGNSAFRNCSSLVSITIPESVTSIGESAFSECSSLVSITIPKNVKSIGEAAFEYCSNLASVTISEGITTIEDLAFARCSITSFTLPKSVTKLGSSVFLRCNLETLAVKEGNDVYDNRDNCNAIIETATNTLVCGCKNTIIPETTTCIGQYAFEGCPGLESIKIPNSVKKIETGAFASSDLVTITIPESITSIEDEVFSSCENLVSVIIPEGVTNIGREAFHSCYKLVSITLPKSVTNINNYAFGYCNNLEFITVMATVPPVLTDHIGVSAELPVYVPEESVSSYKNAEFWTDLNIIGKDMTSISDVITDRANKTTYKMFSHDGKLIIRKADKTYDLHGVEMRR